MNTFIKDRQYYKFCAYGFLKNLRFYDAFLLLFFIENGIPFSQIGVLYAAREIITIIIEVPSGIIADTYGRKNALIASFFLYILSFIIFYYSVNFTFLFIAIVISGIGDAFRSGTHKGMIMDYLRLKDWQRYKIKYYGNTRAWSQRGSAISALIAGTIVFYSGDYRTIYLYTIIPYFLNFINVYTYPDDINYSAIKATKDQRASLFTVFKSFLIVIRMKNVFYTINSAALHTAYLKSIKDYIQPIMVQISLGLSLFELMDTKKSSGLLIGVIYFFIFVMNAIAAKSAYRMQYVKRISQLSLIVGLMMGIACGYFEHEQLWIISLSFFMFIYIVENIRKPILTGILADQVPNEIFTSVISAQSLYRTLISALLAVLIGVLVDRFDIGISLMVVSFLLVILTLGTSMIAKKY